MRKRELDRKNLPLPKLMTRDDMASTDKKNLPPPPPVDTQHYLTGVGEDLKYLMAEEGVPFEEALEDALGS